MENQDWFQFQETSLADTRYKKAIHAKFDQLEQRVEDAFDSDKAYIDSGGNWGTKILFVDPYRGEDIPEAGNERIPYKTLNYAFSQLPICPDTDEGAIQWLLEKIVFWCAPGVYTEGGTYSSPNNVNIGMKRARVSVQGDGVLVRGGLNFKYDIQWVPGGWDYVTKYKPNQPFPYDVATSGGNPLPCFDLSGDTGGMEGGHPDLNVLVSGPVKFLFGATGPNAANRWGTMFDYMYIMMDNVQLFSGVQIDFAPEETVLGSCFATLEVDSSSISGLNLGSNQSTISFNLKAHNTQLKSVIGPRAELMEIDGCRISGGLDRTYGGATGTAVTFRAPGTYSGISSCGIPGTLFNVGSGTGTVTIYGDAAAIEQLQTKTLNNGTGTVKLKAMGVRATTTAARPSATLFTSGYSIFDTTLNKPIYVNAAATGWVDASGTSV